MKIELYILTSLRLFIKFNFCNKRSTIILIFINNFSHVKI